MKKTVIYDECMDSQEIGYLYYYEKSDVYSIELSPDLSEWDVPIFLSSFVKRGLLTLPPKWSRRFVEQRIVPRDRQNLGSILKANGLRSYDTYKLLILSDGRCAQDDCAIRPAGNTADPIWLADRNRGKLDMVVCLHDFRLISLFRDQTVRLIDMTDDIMEIKDLQFLKKKPDLFQSPRFYPGGIGISWGLDSYISAEELHAMGDVSPLSADDIYRISQITMMDTAEVCERLGCTRQYVHALVTRGDLRPVRSDGTRLYHRGDVERLTD